MNTHILDRTELDVCRKLSKGWVNFMDAENEVVAADPDGVGRLKDAHLAGQKRDRGKGIDAVVEGLDFSSG